VRADGREEDRQKDVRAVAICGSRHAGGSTEHLLKQALKQLQLRGIEGSLAPMLYKRVLPCRNCGACQVRKNGTCRIEGDDFASLYKAMRDADVLLIGAPVDHGAAHPDIKALLTRASSVAIAEKNPFMRKPGSPVAVLAQEASRSSLQRLLSWFPTMEMIVPGAAGYAKIKGSSGLPVRADAEGYAVMDSLAENLAWLARKLTTTES
jgi:multimeric flavodoxin WrbA